MGWKIFFSSVALSVLMLVPLGYKWQISRTITLSTSLWVGVFVGTVLNAIYTEWHFDYHHGMLLGAFLIGTISVLLLLLRFYRDPERVPPRERNVILSPADGKIIYVKKIENGTIPYSEKKGKRISLNELGETEVFPTEGFLIGIAMNFLDVHVNRSPIGGKIRHIKHIRGRFLSLKNEDNTTKNERTLTVIENEYLRIGILQIASRLVRRIIPYFQEGDEVQRGDRIGMICFGSQVDLILPKSHSLVAEVSGGERVQAGTSILARFKIGAGG